VNNQAANPAIDRPAAEARDDAGTAWSAHRFRALMSQKELAEYESRLAAEFPPAPESFGGIGAEAGADYRKFIPRLFPGHFPVFAALFNAFYWLIAPLAAWGDRRRPPSPRGRPVRVARMVSMITQGGVAKVCLQGILPLDPAEVELHLLVFGEKRIDLPELRARPHITLFNRKMVLWPGSYRFKAFGNVFRLAGHLRRIRPDALHVHEPQFAPVARMAAALAGGMPVAVHLHNDYTERSDSIPEAFLPITLHALRRCRPIACSETIEAAGRAWIGPTRHPIVRIEDGADDIAEQLPNDGLPERLAQAAAGRPIVAMMAHIVPHKRIDDFLSGCRILQDEGYPIFALLMAYGKKRKGPGLRRDFNRRIAPEGGEFLYSVPMPGRLLPQVRVGVSTSALEGLGLNILEFQMAGVPVVCSNLRPHREMVEDGATGLLFEGLNVADFVAKMRRLLDDPELGRRLGEAGRASAARRRWADTARATAEFYRSLIDATNS
jgi:glycosyltransferase involved in cell wall biosynthesis